MAGNLPHFPFYAEDWLSSPQVRAMSPAGRGVYIDLLAMCWATSRCELPAEDVHDLTKDLRESDRRRVRGLFVDAEEGFVTNSRLKREWDDAQDRVTKKRGAAAKRWQSKSNADALQVQCHPQPHPQPTIEESPTDSCDLQSRGFGPDQLVALYREILPELAAPRAPIGKALAKSVAAALKRDGRDPEAWRAYFASVREMPWLMGQKGDFAASLPWLLGPKNRAKVEGGQYVRAEPEKKHKLDHDRKDLSGWNQ